MALLENNSKQHQNTISIDLPSIGINAQTTAFNVRKKFTDYSNKIIPIKDQYLGNTDAFEKNVFI